MESGDCSYSQHAINVLRDEGLKLTPQRLAVIELFDGGHHHWTPQSIFSTLEPSIPSLSLATVYNTVDLFEKVGLVKRVTARDGATYFDTHLGEHHHAICENCGSLFDVVLDGDKLDALIGTVQAPMRIEAARIWFEGTCRKCAQSSD